MDTMQFIDRAKAIHGDRYIYDRVSYVNNKTKVTIVCPDHGPWDQVPGSHLRGARCRRCFIEGRRHDSTTMLDKFRAKHGDRFDYSHSRLDDYNTKITIGCRDHGQFQTTPAIHLAGHGCPGCAKRIRGKKCRKDQEIWIMEARKTHGDTYDYSFVEYRGAFEKVNIICPEHGVFRQDPTNHRRGSGCPQCAFERKTMANGTIISGGENEIAAILLRMGIRYEREKTFDWLVNPRTGCQLRYDFHLPDLGVLVEYDGPHHFIPVSFGTIEDAGAALENIRFKDALKDRLAIENGLRVIRVRYDHRDRVSMILSDELEPRGRP
jgi:hypothetical protein